MKKRDLGLEEQRRKKGHNLELSEADHTADIGIVAATVVDTEYVNQTEEKRRAEEEN